MNAALVMPLVLTVGLLLDRLLGEPARFHPLVGFGRLADAVESRCNADAPVHHSPLAGRIRGILALLALLVPFVLAAWWLRHAAIPFVVDALALYLALGWRSLRDHALAVRNALRIPDLPLARQQLARIVTRDTNGLDESRIAGATIESVLENGNDALFGALFWCLVGGAPAVVAYRLSNTLDAMWGYRSPRFLYFGWAAARLDDLLNYLPARFTAAAYVLVGNLRKGLCCWREQTRAWSSPNAGPVMAAGAGSLGLQLGGMAIYDGKEEIRPALGCGRAPAAADIDTALSLLTRAILVWLFIITCGAFCVG